MGFPVTVNGVTYTAADFAGYGYQTKLPELISDAATDLAAKQAAAAAHVASAAEQVALAEDEVALAAAQVALATAQANLAAASAATALAAPGTSATSATSLTIALGAQVLTIQAGKALVHGMPILLADAANPATNWMWGPLTSYNAGTGELHVTASAKLGSGTINSWVVSLSPNPNGASGGITTVTPVTTVATLTNTPQIVKCAMTKHGESLTFAPANTCVKGPEQYIIDNSACAFPVPLRNSAGTLLGFAPAGAVLPARVTDDSSAAGVWAIEGIELVGVSAQLITTNFAGLSTASAGGKGSIDLGDGREVLVGWRSADGYLIAVIRNNNTNSYGAELVVRAANIGGATRFAVGKVSATKLLVVSCTSSSAAFEAVHLTANGDDSLTLGTAATATLSANLSSFADGCGLVETSAGWCVSYLTSTPTAELRGIDASGATPAISSATTLAGTAGALIAATGNKVIAVSTATTNAYTNVYTINGSTAPAAGTGTTDALGLTPSGVFKLGALGTGRWVWLISDNATVGTKGIIISLSGTATATSLSGPLCGTGNLLDAMIVGANKVLVLCGSTATDVNILTDSGGTASSGTAIAADTGTARQCLFASGTDVYTHVGTTASKYHVIDCSGASPVARQIYSGFSSSDFSTLTSSSNAVFSRDAKGIYGSAYATFTIMNQARHEFRGGVLSACPPLMLDLGTVYRGTSDNVRWIAGLASANTITKLECVA